MSAITELLKTAASKGDSSEISELLTLCDNIYYTGRNHRYKGKDYTIKDIPLDDIYEQYRKEYTPDYKPTDYFVLKTPKGAKEGLIKHTFPMGSLSKYKGESTAKLRIIFGRVKKIFISAKVDGVSLRCWFINGSLIQAVTRYDHQYGRLVTDKASLFVPRPDASFLGRVAVRGEIVMRGESYKKLGYARRMNGAAGIFGQEGKYTNVKEELHFVAYELTEYHPDDGLKGWPATLPDTMSERFKLMEKMGYEVAPYSIVGPESMGVDPLQKILDEFKGKLDYDIDGLVISPDLYEEEDSDPPKMKVAFKGSSIGEWTIVTAIEPRATKTGNVIPQVYIQPIVVDGSNINTIAGANYNILIEKDIQIGSRVYVVKSGGVIPFIEAVDNTKRSVIPALPPKHCPSCGTELVVTKDERILKCPNDACPEKRIGKVKQFVEQIGVMGLGAKRIAALNVETIEELYALSTAQITSFAGFGMTMALSLYNQMRSSISPISEEALLSAIAPDMIGKKTAALIVSYIPIKELFGNDPVDPMRLTNIPGIGSGRANQLIKYHRQGSNLLRFLEGHGLKLKPMPRIGDAPPSATSKESSVVCLTEKGPHTRAYYETKIKEKGWRSVNSVSTLTTFVVAKDVASTTAKAQQARTLGIPIITYEDFEKKLDA